MKRILFLTKFPPPFTGQTVGTKLIYELVKNSKIFLVHKIDFSIGLKKGEGIINVIKYYILTLFKLKEIFSNLKRHKKVDIIYGVCPSSTKGLIQLALILSFFNTKTKKIFLHVRTGNLPKLHKNIISKRLLKFIINKKVRFIFLSLSLKNSTNEFIKNKQKTVINNIIDEEVIANKKEISQSMESRDQNPITQVCYISNFIRSKGYLDLLNSLDYIDSKQNIKIVFVGSWLSNRDKQVFLKKIDQKKLNGIVSLLNPIVERKKIKTAYLKSHIFCLPTYYPFEAQPRSIIESFANGTPVISCNHASVPEYVKDGVNGILVEKKSPEKIAKAIEVISNQSNWLNFSRNARRTYEKNFEIEMLGNQLINYFSK